MIWNSDHEYGNLLFAVPISESEYHFLLRMGIKIRNVI